MFFTHAQRVMIRNAGQLTTVMGGFLGAFTWHHFAFDYREKQSKKIPVKAFPLDKDQYPTLVKRAGIDVANYLILTLGAAAVGPTSLISYYLLLNAHAKYPRATKATSLALAAAGFFIKTQSMVKKEEQLSNITEVQPK